MPLSNEQIRQYDYNELQLPDITRNKYGKQVANLIAELTLNLKETTDYTISNFVIAGSFAKHTNLRKSEKTPIDVDLVMFIKRKSLNAERDIKFLIESIRQSLTEIYPNKSVKEFKISSKASTINFKRTGLSVDIVPVIENALHPGYGLQFNTRIKQWFKTCPVGQVEFIQEIRTREKDYRRLVRLAKKWRDHLKLKSLTSYMIELLMAKSLETNGTEAMQARLSELRGEEASIEEKFQKFLLFLARIQLYDRIDVYSGISAIKYSIFAIDTSFKSVKAALVLPDPFSKENNVANRITEVDLKRISQQAQKSWEMSHYASTQNDVKIWF